MKRQRFFLNRKGQSATEFVVLISFMFIVFFIFFFAIQSKIVDASHNQDRLLLKEANNLVKVYFDLGRQSYVDFYHSFVLPDLGNFEYVVELEDNNTLVSRIDDKEYVDFLPYTVKGYILTGSQFTNVIYHYDGVVETSPGVYEYDARAQGLFINVDAEKCFLIEESNSPAPCPLSAFTQNCNTYTDIC